MGRVELNLSGIALPNVGHCRGQSTPQTTPRCRVLQPERSHDEQPEEGVELFYRRAAPPPASLCSLAPPQPPEKLPRCDAPIRGWVRVRTLVHGMHDLGMARSELCRGIRSEEHTSELQS